MYSCFVLLFFVLFCFAFFGMKKAPRVRRCVVCFGLPACGIVEVLVVSVPSGAGPVDVGVESGLVWAFVVWIVAAL